jgi:inositol-phosphate transport system permease protein
MRDVETRPKRYERLIVLALLLASLPLILGFFLLVLSSFSTEMVTNLDPGSFHPTLENWINLFQGKIATTGGIRVNIWRITLNTLVVALGVAGVVTGVSALAGYSLSRIDFRGRKTMIVLLLVLHAFPGVALIVGVYLLYRLTFPQNYEVVGLYSFAYVILARAALEIPMSIWLMKGFFDSIPRDLDESAMIDGANGIQQFFKITLPLLRHIILYIAVIVTADALQIFEEPFILTGGGPANATMSVTQYLYVQGITNLKYGYGSAVGLVLFVTVFSISMIQLRAFGIFREN